MGLEIVRRIRGNVHRSIDISKLEDAVIAHPYFQRLRRIKQLAFLNYVFPGATHTRFEHSLGVMHLAAVAWTKLSANQNRLHHSLSRYGNFEAIEQNNINSESIYHGQLAPTFPLMGKIFKSDYILQTLRLAALLHDLGHPPFSHSGERFLPNLMDILKDNPDMPDYLQEYFQSRLQKHKDQGEDPETVPVRHEVFSILMIDRVLRDIRKWHPHLEPMIDPRDVIAIINHHIAPKSDSIIAHYQALDLCRELISGELDIDRMDYLLRDSRECGVVYGVFDAERILDSLCVYHDRENKKLHVAINLSGLAAFEDYLRARHSMYLQLYFHKTSVAAEAMILHLGKQLHNWKLPANVSAYAVCDEYNIGDKLQEAAQVLVPEKAQPRFNALLTDLLYNRQLWKRVFEITGPKPKTSEKPLEKVEKILEDHNIPYETVSSGSSLTRFRPRLAHQKSSNYLRLIKKDEKQFPRVCAIEDYSDVINTNKDVIIHRIYVQAHHNKEGVYEPGLAKKLLREKST